MDSRQTYPERLPPRNVMDARMNVVDLCRNGYFSQAAQAFERLCEMIKFTPCNDPETPVKVNYSLIQIDNFQKSISSLVRYAPSIQEALDYACFCLNEVPEPLRDESLETTLTINLIYLYKQTRRMDGMKKALELIKTGVEYGYALPKAPSSQKLSRSFQDSDKVFIEIGARILRHFGLTFSADRKSIIEIH